MAWWSSSNNSLSSSVSNTSKYSLIISLISSSKISTPCGNAQCGRSGCHLKSRDSAGWSNPSSAAVIVPSVVPIWCSSAGGCGRIAPSGMPARPVITQAIRPSPDGPDTTALAAPSWRGMTAGTGRSLAAPARWSSAATCMSTSPGAQSGRMIFSTARSAPSPVTAMFRSNSPSSAASSPLMP